MLELVIQLEESYNEATNEFSEKSFTLELEHSLVSLSKWESRFEIPFLSSDMTEEQMFWYIKAMIVTPNFPEGILEKLNQDHVKQINEYIGAKMTATTFSAMDDKPSREIITAELIYYWMVALNIPVDFQHWHLKRLLTLVKVCNIKNQPPKKMSKSDAIRKQKELNAQRRAASGSKG